jgi:hypothetical protein
MERETVIPIFDNKKILTLNNFLIIKYKLK